MDKVRVKYFVDTFSKNVGLGPKMSSILLELMEEIITKYEKVSPYISTQDDPSTVYLIKPQNGKYTTEDFFLNRLMRNVWNVSMITSEKADGYFLGNHTKAHYNGQDEEIVIAKDRIDKSINDTISKYGNIFNPKTLQKKVIMHEFEHALQTRFDNGLDVRYRKSYASLSDELQKGPYAKELNKYDEICKKEEIVTEVLSVGTKCSNESENGLRTYKNTKEYNNLNEILNESECLETSKSTATIYKSISQEGDFYKLNNPESSNGIITRYGNLLRILLGKKKSFNMMYLNPTQGFEFFNNTYNDVFQKIYNSNKTAIELLIEAITNIKEKNYDEMYKLDLVFAKCIEKKVYLGYNNPNVTTEQMQRTVGLMEERLIKNNNPERNNSLDHMKVINDLKENLSRRHIVDKKIVIDQPKEENKKVETEVEEIINKQPEETENNDIHEKIISEQAETIQSDNLEEPVVEKNEEEPLKSSEEHNIFIGEKSKLTNSSTLESEYMGLNYKKFQNFLNDVSFAGFIADLAIIDAKSATMTEQQLSIACDNLFLDLIKSLDEYEPNLIETLSENINTIAKVGKTGQTFQQMASLYLNDKTFMINVTHKNILEKLIIKYRKLRNDIINIKSKTELDKREIQKNLLELKKTLIGVGTENPDMFQIVFGEKLEQNLNDINKMLAYIEGKNNTLNTNSNEQKIEQNQTPAKISYELEETAQKYIRLKNELEEIFRTKKINASDIDYYYYNLKELNEQIDILYSELSKSKHENYSKREVDEEFRSYFKDYYFNILDENEKMLRQISKVQEYFATDYSIHM